ncbi:MAG: hypothetical protein K9L30_07745 [Desulfobacterales bacterium]|nr:hypothetical protein [Desulfobacterales bacterium]
MQYREILILLLVSCVAIFIAASDLMAGDLKIDTTLSTKVERNNNIFYSYRNELDDTITTLSGTLKLKEITERFYAELSAGIDSVMYYEYEELDAVDQFYDANLLYRITPRLKGFGGVGYVRDSRPDRDLDTTGESLPFLGTYKRDKINGNVGYEYRLTEISKTSVSYSYNDTNYDDIQYTDYWVQQLNLGYSHSLNEYLRNTSLKLNFAYSDYNYRKTVEKVIAKTIFGNIPVPVDVVAGNTYYEYDSTSTESLSGTVGFEKNMTELWSISVDIGPQYHETTFIQPYAVQGCSTIYENKSSSSGWSGVGSLTLDYSGEFTNVNMLLSHDLGASSGNSSSVERTTAKISIGYKLTRLSRIYLNSGYIINKAEGGELSLTDTDEVSSWIEPKLRIGFNRYIALVLSYKYNNTKNKVNDKFRERNLVYAQLVSDIQLLD